MGTNKILLIDDDTAFADSFKQDCIPASIQVTHKRSQEELEKILPRQKNNFAAIVLDIRCIIREDQEKEEPGFISVALGYLDQYLPQFPRYILTGDDKAFDDSKMYFIREKIYLKTGDEIQKLIKELKYCVDHSDVLRIKREHTGIYQLFDNGTLDPSAEQLFIKLLTTEFEKLPPEDYRGLLADIRNMQELIYKSIHARAPHIIPATLFKAADGMIDFNKLMKHLLGNPNPTDNYRPATPIYQNTTIHKQAEYIYRCCGEYIHAQPNRAYTISHYTLQSLTYGLLELMRWSTQF